MHSSVKQHSSLIFKLGFIVQLLVSFAVQGSDSTVSYYHNDAFNSPIAATDEQGNLVWRERYAPFGEPQLQESAKQTHKVDYTGHVYDAELGLHYMGGRYYDPKIGRFMSNDPVGFIASHAVSFNRYAYGNNNPYRFYDPDGKLPVLMIPALVTGVGYFLTPSIANTPTTEGDHQNNSILDIIPAHLGGGLTHAAAKGVAKRAVTKGGGKADDFFEGTKYTNKVKGQMKQGDFHSFPESVKGFQDAGKVSKLKGGDGVVREKLELPGSYRGRDGQFEFIKEPNKTINHRLFRSKTKE